MSDKHTMVVCLDDLVGESYYWAEQCAWSLEEHDNQIREDAIDEIIKLVDDELTSDIGMDLFVDRDLLCERLEQLKEHKDE